MANSSGQSKKNGRGKDKTTREMNPNSLNNLKPDARWQKGQSGNPKGQSITSRQNTKMSEVCPFDGQGRTWLEALAEAGLRQALTTPVALSNLQDRQEGKVTQPVEGSLEITDSRELTDEQLAVIAATNIIKNNATRSGERTTEETSSP